MLWEIHASIAGGKVICLISLHLCRAANPVHMQASRCRSVAARWHLYCVVVPHATTPLLTAGARRARRKFFTDSYLSAVFTRVPDVKAGRGAGRASILGDDGSKHDNSRPCLARLPRSLSSAVKQGRNPIKETARCRCRLFFNLHPTFCGLPSVLCEPQVTLIWSCQSTRVYLDLYVARLFNRQDFAGLKKEKKRTRLLKRDMGDFYLLFIYFCPHALFHFWFFLQGHKKNINTVN